MKEGKSWEEVVHDAVDRLSWKEEDVNVTVSKMIEEAKELNVMLDKLAKRL